MKSHHWTLLASIAAALSMAGLARQASPEFHIFASPSLSAPATVVNSDGYKVALKDQNGRTVVLALDSLPSADRNYVTLTMATQPVPPQLLPAQEGLALPLNLEVTCTKERTRIGGSATSLSSSMVEKAADSTFIMHIKVVNKSRQPVGDLVLNYQLCTSSTYNNLGTDNKDTTIQTPKTQTVQLSSLAPGASITMDTLPFTLKSSDTSATWNRRTITGTDGKIMSTESHRKDEFKGIIVTFKRNNVPVFEYLTPGLKKKSP